MHVYTTGQWVLLFFFYCFCGWVWESCYVSACKRHWVNRGFLNGPLLPIYGSGAILILFVTLPVQNNLWLVYLFGTAAATVLEYVTGAVMERLFGVRYWDYSKHPVNLHGYICLSSSVAWGFFAILLVRFLHPPVGRLLSRVPDFLVDPLALLITVAFTVDVVRSVQEALDLKEALTKLTEENENLRHLARRAEVIAAFAEQDLHYKRDRTQAEAILLQDRLEAQLRQHREARVERMLKRQERIEDALQRRTLFRLELLSTIADALEDCRAHLAEHTGFSAEELAAKEAEIAQALDEIRLREAEIRSRTVRSYRRALRILRANPSAIARDFQEAFQALRELDSDKNEH